MITGTDERMTILRMIENNKITAEQGAQLLSAMGKAEQAPDPLVGDLPPAQPLPTSANAPIGHGRRFRVQVSDIASGKSKVSVNLPLSLVRWGLRTGKKFSSDLEDIDMEELADMLEGGEDGQFIEVFDEEDGEHVRVFIE